MLRDIVSSEPKHWMVCHGCAGGASAQHCTAMTSWPSTIQCLSSDGTMSLGIKSSATEGVGQTNIFKNLVPELCGVLGPKKVRAFSPTRLACGVLTVTKGYRLVAVERAVPPSPWDRFPQRSWYQDLGTKILLPRSWYQHTGTKISSSGPRTQRPLH